MSAHLVWYDIAPDHGILELHEALTAPGPALALHVVNDFETGAAAAWWEDGEGTWLRIVEVGIA